LPIYFAHFINKLTHQGHQILEMGRLKIINWFTQFISCSLLDIDILMVAGTKCFLYGMTGRYFL